MQFVIRTLEIPRIKLLSIGGNKKRGEGEKKDGSWLDKEWMQEAIRLIDMGACPFEDHLVLDDCKLDFDLLWRILDLGNVIRRMEAG